MKDASFYYFIYVIIIRFVGSERIFKYPGSRKRSSGVIWPLPPILQRKFLSPASATLGAKFSSTRRLAVLKSVCSNGGLSECRKARPVEQKMNKTIF